MTVVDVTGAVVQVMQPYPQHYDANDVLSLWQQNIPSLMFFLGGGVGALSHFLAVWLLKL